MSVVSYIPVALVKAWIQPLAYAVGFDLYSNLINPKTFSSSFNSPFPSYITIVSTFPYPVVLIQMFSYFNSQYSQPLTVQLDYPSTFVALIININP
jgi:hypothetical protein